MERDWIPPEPAGVEAIGSDEDLDERASERPGFEGEFGERERASDDEAGPR